MEIMETLTPGMVQTKTAVFRQRGYKSLSNPVNVLIVYGNDAPTSDAGTLLWDNDVTSTTVTQAHVETPASGAV